jgi:PrtD family type I secretion system ABC transporter
MTRSSSPTYRAQIVVVMLFSAAINLLFLAIPIYTIQVYGRVLHSESKQTLLLLSVITLSALATMAVLDAIRVRFMVKMGTRLAADLAARLIPAASVLSVTRPSLRSKDPLSEVETIRRFVTGRQSIILSDVPWAPLFMLALCYIHFSLGLFVCLAFLFIVLVGFIATVVSTPHERDAKQHLSSTNGLSSAIVSNYDIVGTMHLRPTLMRTLLDRYLLFLKAQNSGLLAGNVAGGIARFVRLCGQCFALGYGAFLVINDELLPTSIFACVILTNKALQNADSVALVWRQGRYMLGSILRIKRIIALSERVTQRQIATEIEGEIEVEGVTLRSPERGFFILKDVSFRIEPGTFLGIIGPSGAGKTTLAHILAGVQTSYEGNVLLDGIDIRTRSDHQLGNAIGFLPQRIDLFPGMIKENIARFQACSDEEVVAAAQLVGLHERIMAFPKGYETELDAQGAPLSLGEQQRVALARAVFRMPRILILDEPNAHLDADGEICLLAALEELRRHGVTTIIVAHRPSLLSLFDYLLILNAGRVERFASREDALTDLRARASQVYVPGARYDS